MRDPADPLKFGVQRVWPHVHRTGRRARVVTSLHRPGLNIPHIARGLLVTHTLAFQSKIIVYTLYTRDPT